MIMKDSNEFVNKNLGCFGIGFVIEAIQQWAFRFALAVAISVLRIGVLKIIPKSRTAVSIRNPVVPRPGNQNK